MFWKCPKEGFTLKKIDQGVSNLVLIPLSKLTPFSYLHRQNNVKLVSDQMINTRHPLQEGNGGYINSDAE